MRILLGVDGSKSSDRAAALVANLAWPAGSTIDVVAAYPGSAGLFSMPGAVVAPDVVEETENGMEAEAQRMAVEVAHRFATPDLTIETQVLRERAATAILDLAVASDVDLIVLGNRGRGPFESALLGSVSAEVVDQSHRPVLVARSERIERILLADDGSKSAAAATQVVRGWPIFRGASVRVISVADVDPEWNPWLRGDGRREADAAAASQLREQHEALVEATAASLRGAGLKADGEVLDGSPAQRLVEAAATWNADLIVVGMHGRSGLERLLIGSVARSVVYHAPCSVLVVPGPDRAASEPAKR